MRKNGIAAATVAASAPATQAGPLPPISYARYQFPPVIIQHAVWSYVRFTLSCPDVEDLLAGRGLDVSYEARRLRQGRARLDGTPAPG
jgi:hypothetical protein